MPVAVSPRGASTTKAYDRGDLAEGDIEEVVQIDGTQSLKRWCGR